MTMSFVLIPNGLNRLWVGSVTEVQPGNPLAIQAEQWTLNQSEQERFQFIKSRQLTFIIPHCIYSMWQVKDLVEVSYQEDIDRIWVKNMRTKVSYMEVSDVQISLPSQPH